MRGSPREDTGELFGVTPEPAAQIEAERGPEA